MKRSPFLWTCAIAGLLLLLIAASAPKAGKITLEPGSRILIADVQNETGQADLARRVRQVLNLALDQSSCINLYPDTESRAALRWLVSDPQSPVTAGVALQICSRERIPVFLLPQLSRAGGSLILGVRLVEVRNNRISRITPAGSLRAGAEDGLLFALADLGKRIRTILGEEPSSPAMSGDLFFRLPRSNGYALWCLAQSQVLALQKDDAGETALLESSVALAPDFALPRLRLADLYAQRGRTQAAIEQARVASRYSEGLPLKLRHRARATRYILEREYPNALREYEMLVSAFPDDWQTHRDLAKVAFCMADYPRSVEAYGTALRISDLQIESHLGLSAAALFSGDAAAARGAWERAQSIAPEDPRVLCLGAQIDLVESNVAAAVSSLQKAEGSSLPAVRSQTRYLLAQALIYGGRFQAALAALEAGIEDDTLMNDEFSASKKRVAHAQIQALSGNGEKALEECGEINRAAADPATLAAIGILYARGGRTSEGAGLLARMEKLVLPAEAQAWREDLVGEIALASGKPQDAVRAFTRAKQLRPGRPPSEALARAFVQAGERVDAAKEYHELSNRKAEALFPQDSIWFTGTWVQALFDASRCLLEMGEASKSRQYLRNYLWALDGSDASLVTVQEAKALLKGKQSAN